MRSFPRFVLSAAACTLALASNVPVAHAQFAVSAYAPPRIDPRITTLFAHRTSTGETLPAFRRSARFEREGTLPLVVRFVRTPSPAEIAALAHAGVTFQRAGAPLFSAAYSIRTDARGVSALEADPNVSHVESDLPLRAPRPLDVSSTETRIANARRALMARDGTLLDGHGVVIGDVDTGVFFYHPALFRADAGSYPWIDVNDNGRFDPGTDGIDLDRNGSVSPEEVLQLLPATPFNAYGNPIARTGMFRPDRDWLYLDTDQNGQRDFGPTFRETEPAYGEPLFVLDDANRDNSAQPSEHLLRLGTCKVRAILGMTPYFRGSTGDDALINNDPGRDSIAYEAVYHGTGVAGILVSGVPGVTHWLGLAPGADLIVADDASIGESTGTTGALQWEMDQGANILLTEYAPYAYVTLDGSSEEEQLLDAALAHNVVPVSPAGNLAQSKKHRHLTLAPGTNDVLATPDAQFASAALIQISLHNRQPARVITIGITLPNGTTLSPPRNAPSGTTLSGYTVYTQDQVTSRGTHEQHVLLYRRSGFPTGDFTIHLDVDDGAPVQADLYVGDDVTSWGGGFQFDTGDEATTVCHPATSDHTLAVAAYVLHGDNAYGAWGAQGDRAAYSSMGPRIDGEVAISIAAPDNPMSLAPMEEGSRPLGSYAPFGGTSGAGPHVAASVALLRQLYPSETAEQIRARIVNHARVDDTVRAGGPNAWGAGRLDLSAAAELSGSDGQVPRVSLHAPSPVLVGADETVDANVTDDEPLADIRLRWDLDSDGHPDTDWVPMGPQHVDTSSPRLTDVRVEVRDAQGNLAASTTRIEIASTLAMNRDAGLTLRHVRAEGGCSCGVLPARHRPPWPRWLALLAWIAGVIARRHRRHRSRAD